MLARECLDELRSAWLPHMTDTGLDRLINLLEKGSPLLIHGCFTRAVPMGCLATQIAWNHPLTSHLTLDAGITWLHRVAGLNPATSQVLREWDRRGVHDLELRADLLRRARAPRESRTHQKPAPRRRRAGRAGLRKAPMLPRTLEPEVMDSPEEARDYDAMDHSGVNRVFVADFLAVWKGSGSILDVGTGTAQIPLELCRQSASAQVTAIDLAVHMLRLGHDNVQRAGLSHCITLERRDAKKLPYAANSFGAVISNSIVHHIPQPALVLAEMVRVAAPGGVFFVRDLLRPEDEAAVRQLVALYATGANAHQQQMFADSLRAALTLPEIRTLVADLGFALETVQQTTDRHWTWRAVKPAG